MDAGLGTPRICMQDEPTGVPINRTTRFENKVGSLDLVAGESPIKKHILESKRIRLFLIFLVVRAWIGILFSLSGLPGKLLFRLPFGLRITSGFLTRFFVMMLFGLVWRSSILHMDELMRAAAQFCSTLGGGTSVTGSGGQPSGSSILPVLPEDRTRERDAGSPDWETLAPIQELPDLEGRQGQPAEGDVVDLEAGPSNSPQPNRKQRFIDDRLTTWKTRDQIALDREIEEGRQRMFSNFQTRVVNIFKTLNKKQRGFEFPMSVEKWNKAIETLLREESSEVWKQKSDELNGREWIDGPFFRSVRNFLINKNNQNKRRKRR